MTTASTEVSTVLINKVGDWLAQTAMAGAPLDEMVRGFCERLAAAGMPLARVNLSFSILHPLYRASGFSWRRSEGVTGENYRHVQISGTDLFTKSPYYYLRKNNLDHLRRRLDPAEPSEFPILDELKAAGITDYLAFHTLLDSTSNQALFGSWSAVFLGGWLGVSLGMIITGPLYHLYVPLVKPQQ